MFRCFLTILLTLFCLRGDCQYSSILKGASDFRMIVMDSFMTNFQQVEKIRQKLDTLGIDDEEFDHFCDFLGYVSSNLYNGELDGRQYIVNALKSSRSYNVLSEKELSIIIHNLELISISRFGIMKDRFPHRLDVNSLRLKEIAQYGIEKGEHILHFSAMQTRLSELLYLSFDSVRITYNPLDFTIGDNKIFDAIAGSGYNSSSKLEYLFEKYPKPSKNQQYDKIIFDCMGILFFRVYPNFKKKIKTIHKLLAADGEFIVGANYQTLTFDGPFKEIIEIDKKIERILECGFEVKEKIYSKGEYLVYKFKKVEVNK